MVGGHPEYSIVVKICVPLQGEGKGGNYGYSRKQDWKSPWKMVTEDPEFLVKPFRFSTVIRKILINELHYQNTTFRYYRKWKIYISIYL